MDEDNPVAPEDYGRGPLCEEAGEIIQMLGKSTRFGIDTPGPDRAPYFGMTGRQMLELECGNMLAAIKWATMAGLIRHGAVSGQRDRKLAKLLDPESRDNLGRRLAPPLIAQTDSSHGQ